jgi:hypothetical protein
MKIMKSTRRACKEQEEKERIMEYQELRSTMASHEEKIAEGMKSKVVKKSYRGRG